MADGDDTIAVDAYGSWIVFSGLQEFVWLKPSVCGLQTTSRQETSAT